jgi:transcriptional regulator with XRE-family HTH domain
VKATKNPELLALKGKMREKDITYRKLAKQIGISLNTLNGRLNGHSVFNIDEVNDIAIELNIEASEIVRYFFPTMLRNETNGRED